MLDEYNELINQAKKNRKSMRNKIAKLRKMRKGLVDKKIHTLHEKAFEKIDCLDCANCCKTTGPLFNQTDIDRIAGHLGISGAEFIKEYLRIDEDKDYVLETVPCIFLSPDNYCSIYEVRPKACREYPHTDRVNQSGILKLTEKNINICPAVSHIFQNLEL